MKPRKYQLPDFLEGRTTQAAYDRWLQRKAAAHCRRDRARGNGKATISAYKIAIHRAVCDCGGLDEYTGEPLRWDLMSKYDNEASKAGRRHYKAGFARLPSVDHIGDGIGKASFKICAWRTNSAKNDLVYDDFVDLCRRVVARADGARVARP